MGFDLYGLSPQENTSVSESITKFINDDGWPDWDKMTKEDRDEYFKAKDKWQNENPGDYFRANVWWWRPLWTYICNECEDILTEKDMERGTYNDGWRISKTKAKRIASRVRKLDKEGSIMEHELRHKRFLKSMPLEECNICDGTGKRVEAPNTGAGTIHCNGCDGKGEKKNWNCNYPFESQAVVEFGEFCEESGGFEIC